MTGAERRSDFPRGAFGWEERDRAEGRRGDPLLSCDAPKKPFEAP